jgi:general secretion pathway protein B
MSYILDALRRAESERERGLVPHLHSQASARDAAAKQGAGAQLAPRSAVPWMVAGALGLGLLAALALWRWAEQDAQSAREVNVAGVASTQPMPPPLPSSSAPTPSPAPSPALAPTSASTPPTAVATAPDASSATRLPTPASAPASAPSSPAAAATAANANPNLNSTARTPTADPSPAPAVRRAPAPAPAPSPSPSPATGEQRTAATAPVATPPSARPNVAASPNPRNDDRVLTRQELPADVQRQLPTLAMSGSVHSTNPRSRMVIVDGKLVFEGDQAAPGITVDRIDPKAVILRTQGLRFSIPL